MGPWGNSAEGALRWSYGMLNRTNSTINLLGELRGATKNRSEMEPIEFRAQAALIRKEVEELSNMTAACLLIACHLPRPTKERLDRFGRMGMVDRMLPMRRAMTNEVADWLLGHPGVVENVSALREIVTQYALGRSSLKRIARALRTHQSNVHGARDSVYTILSKLYDDGLNLIRWRLEAKGLI